MVEKIVQLGLFEAHIDLDPVADLEFQIPGKIREPDLYQALITLRLRANPQGTGSNLYSAGRRIGSVFLKCLALSSFDYQSSCVCSFITEKVGTIYAA